MPYNNDIPGYIRETELQLLEHFAKAVPEHGVIVEVGSFMGRSGYCLASSAPTARVFCIDDFYEHDWIVNDFIEQEKAEIWKVPNFGQSYNVQKEFIQNTKDCNNITMIKGHCPDVVYPGDEIDLLFVDTTHKNPNDWDVITFLAPFVKEGGIICGHDYGHAFPDVVRNVSKLENLLGIPRTIHPDTYIWSFKLNRKLYNEELKGIGSMNYKLNSWKDFQIDFLQKFEHDVPIYTPSVYREYRGEIFTTYHSKDHPVNRLLPDNVSIHSRFSRSYKGVLRGLHYDNKTWKLVQSLVGDIYLVVLDMRESSPTYGLWESYIITDKTRQQVLIPPGFANGHLALTDCVFHYNLFYEGDYVDEKGQGVVKWNDPNFNIEWPESNPILQRRDRS